MHRIALKPTHVHKHHSTSRVMRSSLPRIMPIMSHNLSNNNRRYVQTPTAQPLFSGSARFSPSATPIRRTVQLLSGARPNANLQRFMPQPRFISQLTGGAQPTISLSAKRSFSTKKGEVSSKSNTLRSQRWSSVTHLATPVQYFADQPAARGISKKKKKGGKGDNPWYEGQDDGIGSVFNLVEKSFGKGSVMLLGDNTQHKVPVISTGSIGLDSALGTGGLPRGRIIEVFGPESSGKTTLALHACAQAHKMGGKCAFIDAEHALDVEWAKKIGVHTNKLLLAQPDSGEQALDIVQLLIESGEMDVIVVDSVAALVPKAELEGDMGAHHIGTQARLMSLALRKIQPLLAQGEKKTVMIFLNQIRMKVGTFGFGSPETTSGGTSLKYAATQRIDMRKIGQLKEGDRVVGNNVRARIVKNKLAPPFREAVFEIGFTQGISHTAELLDLGTKFKLIEKTGAWFGIGEERFQGREKAKQYLADNPEVAQKIEVEIRQNMEAIDPSTFQMNSDLLDLEEELQDNPEGEEVEQ